ncbi:MAG: alpha/beta hydrolase [Akkermansiaceae bacterium]
MIRLLQCLILTCFTHTSYAKDHEIVYLWPDKVPGQAEPKAEPVISENNKGNVTRLAKVTNPALVVYEADPKLKNGAAIIICPGGGYNILAVDLEGYEVAEKLSKIGYTTFVLQYRVPQNQLGALQDAQRAIRHVRSTSKQRGIDADKIGIMGFSAGGSLSARASTQHQEILYKPVDQLDNQSARPDFAALIYPAYLDKGPDHSLTPELKLTNKTPPMFLFVAADDRFANSSLVMGAALRQEKIPFELHILPSGGHGFGLRPGKRAAETWPTLLAAWLEQTVMK